MEAGENLDPDVGGELHRLPARDRHQLPLVYAGVGHEPRRLVGAHDGGPGLRGDGGGAEEVVEMRVTDQDVVGSLDLGRAQWQSIAREFNVTDVITSPDWSLRLPVVARDDDFALYAIR